MNFAADPALTGAQLQAIGGAKVRQAARTAVLDLDGRLVVVKGQRAARLATGYHLLNLFAWLAGQPCLRAAPAHGGAQAQALELARLRELAQAGVAVPKLLHEASDYFVMSHAQGPDLASHLPRSPLLLRQRWNLGLAFLREVHARGQYLSQAFARNLIVTNEGIVAIDFEDDPRQVMSLHAAQTRDWLAYLHSTLWLLPWHEPWVVADLLGVLNKEAQSVRQALRELARGWGWLRRLPKARRPWGRDLIGLQALAEVLVQLDGRSPAPS